MTDLSASSDPGESRKLTQLLVAVVALLLLNPAANALLPGLKVVTLLFFLVVMAALRAVDFSRPFLLGAALLAAPGLVLDFAPGLGVPLRATTGMRVVTATAYASFLTVAIAGLFRHLVGERTVTADTVRGGLAVYLLLGCLWALLYQIDARLDPGAFSPAASFDRPNDGFLYFSFTTLTTLGYGDIVPVTPPARMLSWLEALSGQLFVAVLIARFVGLHGLVVRSEHSRSEQG